MPTLAQDTEVDLNPWEQVVDSVESMGRTLFDAAPRVLLAVMVLMAFWVVARGLRVALLPRLERLRTPSFARVFSSLAFAGVVVIGLVVALPIALPSVSVGSMLAGMGILGVAAGFAFQDILSNLLAGILLIFRQPFEAGDQIEVDGFQGTVEAITIRETRMMTFDGRLVVVPNADVYTNAIEVQTAEEHVRTSLVVGVSYDDDLGRARQVALDTLAATDGVLDDPAPQAYYLGFGASSIDLDLRYWSSSRQDDLCRVQGDVVERIKATFDRAGIEIPFSIVTLDAGDTFDRVLQRAAARAGNGRQPAEAGRASE